jgi:hypothetical protein
MKLPEIVSPQRSERFLLRLEGVEDLFYDGLTNPSQELVRIQAVIDSNATKMNSIFTEGGRSTGRMNRDAFRHFVKSSTDLDAGPADEIFSCATNLYDRGDDGELTDCFMSRGQFTIGIVRLANLWTLMASDDTVASHLATQISSFLNSIRL